MVSDMVLSGNGQQLVAESYNEYLLREKFSLLQNGRNKGSCEKDVGSTVKQSHFIQLQQLSYTLPSVHKYHLL